MGTTIVYQQPTSSSSSNYDGYVGPVWIMLPLLTINEPQYHGYLSGHQDWITCFMVRPISLLASPTPQQEMVDHALD